MGMRSRESRRQLTTEQVLEESLFDRTGAGEIILGSRQGRSEIMQGILGAACGSNCQMKSRSAGCGEKWKR